MAIRSELSVCRPREYCNVTCRPPRHAIASVLATQSATPIACCDTAAADADDSAAAVARGWLSTATTTPTVTATTAATYAVGERGG